MGTLLGKIFDSRSILINLDGKTKEAIFSELVDAIADIHPEFDRTDMLSAIWTRENKMSTGISNGVAIPHASCGTIRSMAGAVGISRGGISYDALDNQPVHVIFMLIMGTHAKENHLRILNQIVKLTRTETLETLKSAGTPKDAHAILAKFE